MRWLTFLAVCALATFSALNWRAQLRTHEKFDALTAALAERPAAPPAPVALTPATPERSRVTSDDPVVPAAYTESPARPRDDRTAAKFPAYVIEAPDVLQLEVAVRDPKTNAINRLPNQPITGHFLVRQDGTVGLGAWGAVFVSGLTKEQAALRLREHVVKARPEQLAAENLVVAVDVVGFNSKGCYVIVEGGAAGQQVYRLPITGNECVLDVIVNSPGPIRPANGCEMRLVRPGAGGKPDQVLKIDWAGITQHGRTETNYQLFPGDRLYVTGGAAPRERADRPSDPHVGGAPTTAPTSAETRIPVPPLQPNGLAPDFTAPVVKGPDDRKQFFNFSVGVFGSQ